MTVQQTDDDWVQSVLTANFSYIHPTLHRPRATMADDRLEFVQWLLLLSLYCSLKPNNNLFSLQPTASPLPALSTSYFVILFHPPPPPAAPKPPITTAGVPLAIQKISVAQNCLGMTDCNGG